MNIVSEVTVLSKIQREDLIDALASSSAHADEDEKILGVLYDIYRKGLGTPLENMTDEELVKEAIEQIKDTYQQD